MLPIFEKNGYNILNIVGELLMKRKLGFLLTALMTSLTLSGCDFLNGIISIEDNDSSKGEPEVEYVVDQEVVDNYYKSYDLTKNGAFLARELQKLCFEKHTVYITYGQVNSYYVTNKDHDSAEAVSPGSTINEWFYTGKHATGTGTREHVWPCANSGNLWAHDKSASKNSNVHNVDLAGYVGGGSDLFHVRTANSAVNTARGNSKFVDFDDADFDGIRSTVAEYGESKGKYNIKIQGHNSSNQYADKCEPDDHMKGDVARIVLYVWTHYAYRSNDVIPSGSIKSGNLEYSYKDMCGGLDLAQIMGYDSLEKCKAALASWNELDPPSSVEKLRNDTVQKIQGNRNPYVDHPELVKKVLGVF